MKRMCRSYGGALEHALDSFCDAMGRNDIETVYNEIDGHIAIFRHNEVVGTATSPAEAGKLLAKVIQL